MNRFFKISALLVLAVSFWSFPFLSSAQDLENKNLFGFFGNDEPKENPPAPEAKNNPSGLLNPGKAIPTLNRCAEFGAMHVHQGAQKHSELPRF